MSWQDKGKTRIQIIGALGLPLTAPRWHEWVTRAQNNVEQYGGDDAIAQIEGWVTKYLAAEAARNEGAGNNGVKVLDVIEYFEGGAGKGFTDEMKHYRNLLLDALFWEGEKAQIRRMSSAFAGNSVRIGR